MKSTLIFISVLICTSGVGASVDNFALLDHTGRFHELYYYEKDKDTNLIVIYSQGNACSAVRKRIPELNALKEKYGQAGVRFWMLNANSEDDRAAIVKEVKEFNISWPILRDDTQLVARSLGFSRTNEAVLINPRTWEIVYREGFDGRAEGEILRTKPKKAALRKAIEARLRGRAGPDDQTNGLGTAITFVDKGGASAQISYSKTVAPILLDRCVRCHQQGGIGPFALSSYKKVRGWSGMIREVVMTRRMPPWGVDSHYGSFKNDLSMTVDEKRQLISWIDAGSPRDAGPDPLAAHVPNVAEWPLGKPDLIVSIPEQEIPAEGIVRYRYLTVDLPIKEDVWLRGTHVKAGNTKVLHHVIVSGYQGQNRRGRTGLGGYTPGSEGEMFPEGTGRLLRAGSKALFQLHYTVTGKAETDTTRLGLYFYKEKPEKSILGGLIMDRSIKIPPHEREYKVVGSYTIGRNVMLTRMFPHMHYRGKWMIFEAHYPDGEKEILLSVPNYHFNWQRGYVLKEAIPLPAGTKMVVRAAWDNSVLNPNNPDPSKTVRWGQQSWDEMLFAPFSFTYAE